MKCGDLEFLALDYLDGTLAGAQRAALEQHTAACGTCRTRLTEFADGLTPLQATLDRWASVPVSRTFDAEVFAKIAAESQPVAGWWRGFIATLSTSFLRPAFAGTLSAVLLAAFAVVRYFPGTGSQEHIAAPPSGLVETLDTSDEVALVQELADLDDLDLLRNFEVLQEMKGPTP